MNRIFKAIFNDELSQREIIPGLIYDFSESTPDIIPGKLGFKKEKIMSRSEKEELAFNELKSDITKLMFAFTEKYAQPGVDCLYPRVGCILVDVLLECLSNAEYQIYGIRGFTIKQIDHICYQIGEWYLAMKPLLEGQHNLGYMKERLKIMICGD